MPLDVQIFLALHSLAGQSPLGDAIIVFCASTLAYVLGVAFLLLAIAFPFSRKKKVELLLVTAVSTLFARFGVVELIRHYYHRPRPFVTFNFHPLVTESSWSFPSGHATFFFALATCVFLYNKRWGIAFYVATVLMTLCRVIAGVHYPSDIVGGAILGSLIAYLTYLVAQKYNTKSSNTTS